MSGSCLLSGRGWSDVGSERPTDALVPGHSPRQRWAMLTCLTGNIDVDEYSGCCEDCQSVRE